jgi:GT2 family glycosyltransferase
MDFAARTLRREDMKIFSRVEQVLACASVRSITRRAGVEVCVIMPTFRAAEITSETLRALFEQNQNLQFDVLIVDVMGEDFATIQDSLTLEQRPAVQFVVLGENGGGAAATALGQLLVMEAGYTWLCLADHDAVLRTPDGLRNLCSQLDPQVIGHPLPVGAVVGDPCNQKMGLKFHYLMMHRSLVEKIGCVRPYYFLYVDDRAYVAAARRQGWRVKIMESCRYFHPAQKLGVFGNRAVYLTVLGMLRWIFEDAARVSWRDRWTGVLYLGAYLLMKGIHFFQTRDVSILQSIGAGWADAFRSNPRMEFTEERWGYQPVEKPEDIAAVDLALVWNRIWLRDFYFVRDEKGGRTVYGRVKKV